MIFCHSLFAISKKISYFFTAISCTGCFIVRTSKKGQKKVPVHIVLCKCQRLPEKRSLYPSS